MILDLKKHGSSCHWIPSLYLVDGVHAMWRLFEVELYSYSRNVIMLNKHLPTCCWGLQDKPHRRTPEGHRLWVHSGPSHSRACRPSNLRSCPAVSCPPSQSCWEWSPRFPSWEFFWGKSPAPECESACDIGRWDSLVSVGPEPGTSSHCTLSPFQKQSQHQWNISPWWNIKILQTIRWCGSAAAEQHHNPCSWSCTSSQTSRSSLYCLQNKIKNFQKWRWRKHSWKKRKK